MAAAVLVIPVMTSSFSLSVSCALAVAVVTGACEILRTFYSPGPQSATSSALIVAIASLLSFVVTFFLAARAQNYAGEPPPAAEPVHDPITPRMLRRIALASEHITSLLLVLRIARQYNQPVSSGALHNLTLVEKDLRNLQLELEHRADSTERSPQEDSDVLFGAPALRILPRNIDHATKL
jgi:hypothetical protein